MPMRWLTATTMLVLACGAVSAQPEKPTRESGDKAIEARRILKRHCGECHWNDHRTKPAGSDLGVHDHAAITSPASVAHPLPFVVPRNPSKSLIIELIESGTMPPGGRTRPSPEEVAKLRDWIESAAPSYPPEFTDRYALEQILDDFEKHPEDAAFYRYLSFGHLLANDQVPDDWKKLTERQTNQAFLLASQKSAFASPIDGTATVYRVDLRQSGLLDPGLFYLIEDQKPKGDSALVPFDLVLLEYPHGFLVPDNDPLAPRLKTYLQGARLVRPIPFVRGDWLVQALANASEKPLTSPSPTPLTHELSDLVEYASSEKGKKPFKASEAELFKNAKPVIAKPTAEGWAPLPPLSAVYSRDVAVAKPPFNLEATIVGTSGPTESVVVGTPFSIQLKCDRPVHYLVLSVTADGIIRHQPIKGTGRLDANKATRLTPGNSDTAAFTISGIPGGKPEAMEYFIVIASESDIPLAALQFVRSKHIDAPIYRFLFDPGVGPNPLDATKVVRKVLPLKVTDK